jgi:3-deoxy-D-manno-octulosonic-acid transferase
VVFVGKSLVNLGGQNPLEPAAFKKPILFGPYMFNFELVAEMLIHHGAAVQVANEKELMEQVKSLLLDAERCNMMGMRAYEVLGMNRGAVDKTLKVVEGFL